MPDTGASQSVVSADIARDANLNIRPTITELRNASNGIMNLLGEADVMLCNDKHSAHTIVLVASNLNHSALIGWQDLQKLRVIPASFPAVAAVAQCFKDLTTKTLSAFPTVFSDTLDNKPMCAQRMKIYLKDNSVPYRVSAPRPISHRFQEPANAELSKYIASGIIVPCEEPTDWCSPAFFVPKEDGKRVRLVTDYTKLNQYVIRPVHPFPSVSDIIQSIPASAACFAKLDATHGYFQIPLGEEASKLTKFILLSGRFRYLRAPMGLSSSSDKWCRHSDRIVEGFPWCRKIVDDILICSSTHSELESRINEGLSSSVKTCMSHCHDPNSRLTPPSILLDVLCQPPVLSQTLQDYWLFLTSLRLQLRHQCVLSSGYAISWLSLCQIFSTIRLPFISSLGRAVPFCGSPNTRLN